MPEKLEIEVWDGIVRASVSGAFNLENAKIFFQQILHRAREEKLNMILIDARGITKKVPTMGRFAFGSYMAEQRPYTIKIALVGREDTIPDRFLETVSVNRGVNAKVFTEIEGALKWLAD